MGHFERDEIQGCTPDEIVPGKTFLYTSELIAINFQNTRQSGNWPETGFEEAGRIGTANPACGT